MEVELKTPTEKKVTDGLSPEKLDVIFHRPGCRKLFEEKVAAVRVEDSETNRAVIWAFGEILMSVPKTQLGFSIDELKTFISAVAERNTQIHVGMLIKAMQILDNAKPSEYAATFSRFAQVSESIDSLRKEIDSLVAPIRDICIEEFYSNASAEDMYDIKLAMKDFEQRSKNQMPGMPQGMNQYNFNR